MFAVFKCLWRSLRRFFSRRRRARYVGNQEQQVDIDSEDEEDGDDDGDEHDLFIERIRIQNMNLRSELDFCISLCF